MFTSTTTRTFGHLLGKHCITTTRGHRHWIHLPLCLWSGLNPQIKTARRGKKRPRNHVRLLWKREDTQHWFNWPCSPTGLKCFFGWVNSVSRLHGEAQSDVMAGCNECFPVGWTVTLWMAGAWRPEGEREGMRPRLPSLSRGCSQLI